MPTKFHIGDHVSWTSSARGYSKTKYGTVIAVIPAFKDPMKILSGLDQTYRAKTFLMGGSRPRESYLVAVPSPPNLPPVVYWPHEEHLVSLPLPELEVEIGQLTASECAAALRRCFHTNAIVGLPSPTSANVMTAALRHEAYVRGLRDALKQARDTLCTLGQDNGSYDVGFAAKLAAIDEALDAQP